MKKIILTIALFWALSLNTYDVVKAENQTKIQTQTQFEKEIDQELAILEAELNQILNDLFALLSSFEEDNKEY